MSREQPAWAYKPARAWLRKMDWRDLKTLREIRAEKYVGDWCDEADFARWCAGEHPLVAQMRGPGGRPALTSYGEAVLELDRERMLDEAFRVLPPNRRDIDGDGRRYYITSYGEKWPLDEIDDRDLESTILQYSGDRPGYERTAKNPASDAKKIARLLNPW